MTQTDIKPTREHAVKILGLLDHGLTKGLGIQVPGKMCVEAAVCAAFDLPHSDKPPCVGYAVRGFKITLNDCAWPSDKDRADGMRKLAIAQLGSDTLDQMEFGKRMFLRGTQKLLPFVWRKEAEKIANAAKKSEMLAWCERMEKCETFEAARKLAKDAYAYASAYAYAYASASAYAYAYASASAYAYASAYASAYAYAYASAYAYRHELLKLTASIGVEVLIEMNSPGCKWLSLIKD